MSSALAVVEVWPSIPGLVPRSPLAGMARRQFGGKTLLEWMVRRVSDAERISAVIVLAHDDSMSRILVANCPGDVQICCSRADDALGRLVEVARSHQGAGLVRLNISHPFVDPELIDRLVTTASESGCDYASFCFSDGRSVIESRLGVAAEWCSTDALRRADKLAKESAERAEATRVFYTQPDQFSRKMLCLPPQLDRFDLRLAIQDEEDWEQVQLILDALGPESLEWRYIASLLDRQPAIRARMADRNRQEAEVC